MNQWWGHKDEVVIVPRCVLIFVRSESRRDKDWVVVVLCFVPPLLEVFFVPRSVLLIVRGESRRGTD